jgi:transposase
MGYSTILGLDLGKFKSVGCVMDVAAKTHTFETIQTTPQVLHDWLTKHAADPSSVLLVIETCDTAGWVHDLAASLGVSCTVVHTIGAERWRWHKVKRKTDRDDALKLARLALLGELPPAVHMPSAAQRQKRRLIVHRRSVVTRRTTCHNTATSRQPRDAASLQRPLRATEGRILVRCPLPLERSWPPKFESQKRP